MKKFFLLPLVFLFVACSKGETPPSTSSDADCSCTHTECPCPNNCEKCYCNQ